MKKSITKLLSFFATFTIMLGVSAVPAVEAQETNWEEIMTEIYKVNQEPVSMEGEGLVNLEIQDLVSGNLALDFQYNLDPEFALDIEAYLDALLYSEDAEGEMQSFPMTLSGQAVIFEGMGYLFDGNTWYSEDVSELIDMFTEQYQASMEQAEMVSSEQNVELAMKYFELTETDTEYVMVLDPNLNEEEFWADIEEMLDMETIKADAIEQVIEQTEQVEGETVSPAERQELEEQYDLAFEAGKSFALDFMDHVEVRYSKENYYMTGMIMQMSVTDQELNEMMMELDVENEAEMLPMDSFNMTMNIEMFFENHGENFDIQVPAEALNAESMMESDLPADDFETEDEWESEETELDQESSMEVETSEEETTEENDVE